MDLPYTVPDTITQWVGNSLCISDSAGFGLSPITSITTFQPFFLSINLPYNAVRGERLPITITIYNYLDKCLHVGGFFVCFFVCVCVCAFFYPFREIWAALPG